MQNNSKKLNYKPAMASPGGRTGALSLIEVLAVVAVIGILAAIAMPMLGDISPMAKSAKTRANAQNIARVSSTLAGLGVAHVIPQSMGGVEATVRLLREGVTVTHELFENSVYSVPNLSDDEVTATAEYLDIIYDTEELRLIYTGEETPVAMIW